MPVQTFRYSPHANRANEIHWHEWGDAAFDAAGADRLVFLHLTAVWSRQCQRMDEEAFSNPDVVALLNGSVVPVRVDADRLPHVQDRYIAGGWPTNALLTPTGEVLWAATYLDADELLQACTNVLTTWNRRRDELTTEIERRRRALETARTRHTPVGLVRREPADDVLNAITQAFDARNGGFGDAPKFVEAEAVELLQVLGAGGDADALRMATHTLDGMLAGELLDAVDGGFFRYTLAADWTQPRREKLLAVNAGLIEVYARGAVQQDRADWRVVVERTVQWADTVMLRSDGLWNVSQADHETWYALDSAARARTAAPCIDNTLYTNVNARWIAALANAGRNLQREEWVVRAAQALDRLIGLMQTPEGVLAHYRTEGGEPEIDFLLIDTLAAADAAMALAEAEAGSEWTERARELTRTLERCFWMDDGGFWERRRSPHDVGALRYRERPFEPNAVAARLLVRLANATGERGPRARAERVLAVLSHGAARYGVAGAIFALAVEEFFDGARMR
ncbi:MAG TPA: DUF255 domain-containing protein [Longimicrobiales bacterium]|nr:DUF255 domain-containing protein [Longimicrobiales bacterium]